jgi:hypothetical protein
MIQKILLTASLGGLLLIGAPGVLQGRNQQGQEGQQSQQQATKTISGKVTGIGDQGHSFTVDTEGNGSSGNQTMQFVVDKNTRVQGQVKVGTMVTVDYQPINGGQLLCVRVAAQNS